jgi:hypothetical protein
MKSHDIFSQSLFCGRKKIEIRIKLRIYGDFFSTKLIEYLTSCVNSINQRHLKYLHCNKFLMKSLEIIFFS